jgi:hypothetical protein
MAGSWSFLERVAKQELCNQESRHEIAMSKIGDVVCDLLLIFQFLSGNFI